ncbi:MAG: hypothetical protein RL689_1396 [Planctomycetota bacterium]|jgi:hypothetical protein
MAKKPQTVRDYVASLPPDRRAAVETLRKVVLANLDEGIEEGMQYGMIGYFIPHARYPAGYHCDPAQPLPFAGLASQKGHLSLYLMGCYAQGPWKDRFVKAWKASGKKLDMGAACVRFKSIDQVPLDVVADTIRDMTVDAYIAQYESAVRPAAKKAAAKPARKPASAKAPAAKKAAKSAAQPKGVSKKVVKTASRRSRS